MKNHWLPALRPRQQQYAQLSKDFDANLSWCLFRTVRDFPVAKFLAQFPSNKLPYWAVDYFRYGDLFLEVVGDEDGPLCYQNLAPATMFRIETVSGELIEFLQSKEGPDYAAIAANRKSETVIRFSPEAILHFKLGDSSPYGVLDKALTKDNANWAFSKFMDVLEAVERHFKKAHKW